MQCATIFPANRSLVGPIDIPVVWKKAKKLVSKFNLGPPSVKYVGDKNGVITPPPLNSAVFPGSRAPPMLYDGWVVLGPLLSYGHLVGFLLAWLFLLFLSHTG